MTFEELFQLKEFKEGRFVAGEEYQNREIRGGHVIEMSDGTNWAEYGSLIFTSGVGFKDPEQELKQLIQTIALKQVAGLVVEIGPYIKEISMEVAECAKRWKVPLFTLPYCVSVSEVISKIYHRVYQEYASRVSMEQLLREVIYEPSEENFERMRAYGFEENQRHVVLYFVIKQESNFEQFVHSIQKAFSEQKQLWMLKGHQKLILLYSLPNSKKEALVMLKEKYQEIQRYSVDFEFRIGVGNPFFRLSEIKEGLEQAKQACELTTEKEPLLLYEEMGIDQLFFQVKDRIILERMAEKQLGRLLQYDRETEGELVDTLRVYLENDGSITKTTECMYVHRNTIKYRIKRIEEILGKDLQDAKVKFELWLAIRIRRFLSGSDFSH